MIKFLILLFTFIQITLCPQIQAAQRELFPSSSREPRLASEAFEDDDSSYAAKRRTRSEIQEITIPTQMFLRHNQELVNEEIANFSRLTEDGKIILDGLLHLASDCFIPNLAAFVHKLRLKQASIFSSVTVILKINGLDNDDLDDAIFSIAEHQINSSKKKYAERLIHVFGLFAQIPMDICMDLRIDNFGLLNDGGYQTSDLFKPFTITPIPHGMERLSALRQRQIYGPLKQKCRARLRKIIFSNHSTIETTEQTIDLFLTLGKIPSLVDLHIGRINLSSYSPQDLNSLGKTIGDMCQLKSLYFTAISLDSFFSTIVSGITEEKTKAFITSLLHLRIEKLGFKDTLINFTNSFLSRYCDDSNKKTLKKLVLLRPRLNIDDPLTLEIANEIGDRCRNASIVIQYSEPQLL